MEERARVRINLAQRELEIEGPESFVRSFEDRLVGLLERLAEGAALPASAAAPEATAGAPAAAAAPGRPTGVLPTFGEFVHHLPANATEVDRMLAAGFWVQTHTPDRTFATAEASRRLAEHGVRIGNPSQCVRQNIQARRCFAVGRGRYRVSRQGIEHLRRLMGDVVPESIPEGTT